MNRTSLGNYVNIFRSLHKHCAKYHRPLTNIEKEEYKYLSYDRLYEVTCVFCGGKPKND